MSHLEVSGAWMEPAAILATLAHWLTEAASRWRAAANEVDRAAARGGAVALGPVIVDAGTLQQLGAAARGAVIAAFAPAPTAPAPPPKPVPRGK